MNGWHTRLCLGLLIWLFLQLHVVATAGMPNTPEAMLAFHGSAAALDVVLLCGTQFLISGRLCNDLEALFVLSVIGNAIGWWLYLAYAPPVIYNVMMWGIGYGQFCRLLYVDRYDDDAVDSGNAMVRLADRLRGHLHFGKATS